MISTVGAGAVAGEEWDVLRLDTLHPVVSGNKIFKLQPWLGLAGQEKKSSILTFGGPWSNHIVATAFAAREHGLASMGIIRGEPLEQQTATLEEAAGYGMNFRFLSRSHFRAARADEFRSFTRDYPDHLVIPEGGAGEPGAMGAERILDGIDMKRYTHIACACGTGTMLAGLVRAASGHQQVWGIDVVGQGPALERSVKAMLPGGSSPDWRVLMGFERGGYARHDRVLLEFMGRFHEEQGIPSDIVYTGKLFLAIEKLMERSPLPSGCRLLAIHSGGLQGNRSLAPGTISF